MPTILQLGPGADRSAVRLIRVKHPRICLREQEHPERRLILLELPRNLIEQRLFHVVLASHCGLSLRRCGPVVVPSRLDLGYADERT